MGGWKRSEHLIDTVAAMTKIQGLDRASFPGSARTSDSHTGLVAERWYRNDEAKPRLTYFVHTGWLRVEWSLKEFGCSQVDSYISRVLPSSSLPPVLIWRCQRVDYSVDLVVRDVVPLLAAVSSLRCGPMQRQAFDGEGVVWKAAGRWVKVYDARKKGTRSLPGREDLLRFEVSNFKQSVRYMAEHWFGCERMVAEMVQPGRALYVLARYYTLLGLGQGFADAEREVHALREAFGQRGLAGAIHALRCIREHGVESYKSLQLMSKSSYYRWLRALREKGFLAASAERMRALRLPCEVVFRSWGENLKSFPAGYVMREGGETRWKNLAEKLGVKPGAPPSKYLVEEWDGWCTRHDLDAGAGEVPEGSSVRGVSRFADGEVARTVAV